MKNHLNILPKLASFDLKCSKMRWRLGLRPRPRWGSLRRSPDPLIVRGNALSALGTLYFVPIFTSQFPFRAPPYGIPGSATIGLLLYRIPVSSVPRATVRTLKPKKPKKLNLFLKKTLGFYQP